MPRINRIRLTNIQYDSGKRQIPDLLLDLNEQDALVLLGNGGGKTLSLQLLMQVVLPNERLQGRRIIELLQSSRYTGHVVVEWLLDSTGEFKEYVCTGFCFSRSSDDALRYFNYIFDYSERDFHSEALSIETLPLVLNLENGRRQPIRWQALRDWFREKAGHQVQIFDQINTYQERLRQYQIIPEEWKNIRDTNDSEGGVDKFFERCKTTTQLMDNLLIPSVEQVIFQSEVKRQELIKAFGEYKYSLLQIPVIKQNIVDFAVVQSQSEAVVQVVQNLNLRQKELDSLTKQLVVLAKTFQTYAKEADICGQKLEEKTLAAQGELNELQWKISSYKVFLKQLDHLHSEKQEEIAKEQYEVALNRLKDVQHIDNQIAALHHYSQLTMAQGDLTEYATRLKSLDLDEPELLQELGRTKGQLVTAWHREKSILERQVAQIQGSLETLEKELQRLQRTKEDQQEELNALHQEQGSVNAWLENYFNEQDELAHQIPGFCKENPDQTHNAYLHKLADLAEVENQVESFLLEGQRDLALKEKTVYDLRITGHDLKTTLQNTTEQILSCERASEHLGALLAEHAIFQLPVLEKKDEILIQVKQLWAGAQEELVVARATIANLEEKWALFQNRDFYVPHPVLLNVKQQLESLGLAVVLGSEWLASQPLSESDKESYVKNYPLLPFSVIVEKGQLNSLRHAIRALQQLPADFPLFFIVRQSLGERVRALEGSFLTVEQDQLYSLQGRDFAIYSSSAYFLTFKEQMDEQLGEMQKQLKELRERAEQATYLKSQVERFYRDFSPSLFEVWLREQEKLREAIKDNEAQINSLDGEYNSLASKIKEGKAKVIKLKEEKTQLDKYIQLLARFLPRHRNYPIYGPRQISLGKEIMLLNSQMARWDDQVTTLHGEKAQTAQDLKTRQSFVEAHTQEFIHYDLEGVSQSPTMQGYEQVKGQVEGVLSKLGGRQSARRDLEDLMARVTERAEEAKLAIVKREISLDWLDHNRRTITQEELARSQEMVKAMKSSCTQRQQELLEAKAKTQATSEIYTTLAQSIRSDYNRDPFILYSPSSHLPELAGYEREAAEVRGTILQLDEELNRVRIWHLENQEAYEAITENHKFLVEDTSKQISPLSHEAWAKYGQKPRVAARQVENKRQEAIRLVEMGRLRVSQAFIHYRNELEKTNNARVRQFVREIESIVAEERLYDFDFVETQFIRIFEAIEVYRRQYQQRLEESEKNFTHLVQLCLRRALTVYESIQEIPKNSRIGLYGRNLQLIMMDWPIKSEGENKNRMEQYLHETISQMQIWQSEGMDDDKLDERLGVMLSTRNLLNILAPIESCRIQVYKPRSESLIRNQRFHHAPWDDVAKWSGGENYSAYITMFMVMLVHIRQQMEGRPGSWKVLVADNPFGKASSGHVLDPIFQVAKANQIQLLCFTAHKEESILRYFPVVYSLQLRSTYGKEVMQAEQLESGFYKSGQNQPAVDFGG